MVEMSQNKQNSILTSLQIRKKYQRSLRRVAVRFSDTLLECSRSNVKFPLFG